MARKKEKDRKSVNRDKINMQMNSLLWRGLDNAQKISPSKYIGRYMETQKGQAHSRNVETGKKHDFKYKETTGEWREKEGEKPFNNAKSLVHTMKENKPTAFERVSSGAKSIAKSIVGSIPTLYETAQQRGDNVDKTRENHISYSLLEDEKNRLTEELQTKVLFNPDGTPTAEYNRIIKRLKEVDEALDKTLDKTPVDQDKFGQRMMQGSREDAAKATEGMSGVPKFVADAGLSIANNLPSIALSAATGNPGVGLALMGAQAAASKTSELNEKGTEPGSALGRGLVAGGIEVATEKIPLDSLFDIVKVGGKPALRAIFDQMGIEATEEGLSYVLNAGADLLAKDPDAHISAAELALAMAGGGFSGAVMGGGGAAVNKLLSNSQSSSQQNINKYMLNDTETAVNPSANPAPTNHTGNAIADKVLSGDASKSAVDAVVKDPVAKAAIENATGVEVSGTKAEQTKQIGEIATQAQENSSVTQPSAPDAIFGKNTVGAAEKGKGNIGTMLEDYGAIPPGEAPRAREVEVPKSTDGENITPKFYRTLMEAEITPDSAIEVFEKDISERDLPLKRTNEKDVSLAKEYLQKHGVEKALNDWEQKMEVGSEVTADDVIRTLMVYSNLAQNGQVESAVKIGGELSAELSRLGQTIQAGRIAKQIGPAGQIYRVQRIISNLNRDKSKLLAKKGKAKSVDQRTIIADSQEAVQNAQETAVKELARTARNPNIPVDQWFVEAGKDMAGKLENRLNSSAPKEKPVVEQVISDLLKFADEHALPKKKTTGQKRIAVDILRDYFSNRQAYTQAWNSARETLKKRYADDPTKLEVFENFVEGTVDYSGDPLHQQKVILSAIMNEIRNSDGMKNVLARSALGAGQQDIDNIANSLIQQTGAQGADAQIIRDAVQRLVTEKTQTAKSTSIKSMVTSAIRKLETSIPNLAKNGFVSRDRIREIVKGNIIAEYGVSERYADKVSETVANEYDKLLAENARKQLEQRFASRGVKATPEFWDTFAEYANLGAFDSQYAQAATERLFGTKDIILDPKLAQVYLEAKDDEARDAAMQAIKQSIADQVPMTWADKWNEIRYTSMLSKPATRVRNKGSNIISLIAERFKDQIAGAIESAAEAKGLISKEDRTKSIGFAPKELRDFAKADFENLGDIYDSTSKFSAARDILRMRKPFGDSLPGRAFESLKKWTVDGLDADDKRAAKKFYTSALSHYMQARGLKPADMTGQTLENARSYAMDVAIRGTFHADSPTARALQNLENQNALTKIILGSKTPYKTTPINVTKRAFEYSPLEIVNVIKDVRQMIDQRKSNIKDGSVTPAKLIDDIAKTASGSALVALGVALASDGLLTGADADDKKEQALNDASGIQSYALNLDNGTYSLGWTAPASLPIFVGVELYNTYKNKKSGDLDLNDIVNSLANITEPMFDNTMLDGINSAIKSVSYGGNPISQAITDSVFDYAEQGIPSVVTGIARTIDGTRRTTANAAPITGIDLVDKALRRTQNKLPFASMGLEPRLDIFGREDRQDNIALRALENLVSPGYFEKKPEGDVEAKLMNLYKEVGDNAVLPTFAKRFSVDNQPQDLKGEAFTKYAKEKGKNAYNSLESLFNSSAFDSLSDAAKIRAVESIYSYANDVAKSKSSAFKLTAGDKNLQAAEKDGISIGNYLAMDALYKQTKLDNEGKEGVTNIARDALINAISGAQISSKEKDALAEHLIINPASEKRENLYSEIQDKVPALSYAIAYTQYSKMKDDKAFGRTAKERNLSFRKWLNGQNLTTEQKNLIDQSLVNDNTVIVNDLDVDYSSPESLYKSVSTQGLQKNWDLVTKTWGIPMEKAQAYWSAANRGKVAEQIKAVMEVSGWDRATAEAFRNACNR